jgi:hypothetical protein
LIRIASALRILTGKPGLAQSIPVSCSLFIYVGPAQREHLASTCAGGKRELEMGCIHSFRIPQVTQGSFRLIPVEWIGRRLLVFHVLELDRDIAIDDCVDVCHF